MIEISTLSHIRSHSMRTPLLLCASSWSMLMVETCTTRSCPIRKRVIICLREKSGTFSFRLLEDCKHFMTWKLFIEISSVLTSSWQRMVWSSLETWMSQRLQREACYRLKLELHTTHHQKFGKISHTTQRVIYGVPVVFFMRCVLLILPLEQTAWMSCARKYARAYTLLFQQLTQLIWYKWWGPVCNKFPTKDHHVLKFSLWMEPKTTYQIRYRRWILLLKNVRTLGFLEPLKCQGILDKSQRDFQSQNIMYHLC